MLVKICGITRAEDAEAAVDAGAAAIGFVFWPGSPRFIDPYRARAIRSRLPPFVTAVGVFVNQPLAHVLGVASLVRLGAVQEHGEILTVADASASSGDATYPRRSWSRWRSSSARILRRATRPSSPRKSIACSITMSAGRLRSRKRGACRRRPAAPAFS